MNYRLKQGLLYAGLSPLGFEAALVDLDNAIVYDTRDNAEMKAKFFSALLGGKFEIEPAETDWAVPRADRTETK